MVIGWIGSESQHSVPGNYSKCSGFPAQKILEPLLMSTKTILLPEINHYGPLKKGVNYKNLTMIPSGPIVNRYKQGCLLTDRRKNCKTHFWSDQTEQNEW